MEFQHEKKPNFCRGRGRAESCRGDFSEFVGDTVNINHTYVDDSLRGQGVADQLLRACTDDLRAGGKQAVATCSYAKRWFGSHPECRDLLCEAQRKLMEEERADSGQ
jgi:GNAT superfamily N-acetyltransferase